MYAADTAATQDIKKSSVLKNLDVVWQHVVESNVPPSDANLVIGTCLITGKTNAPCIVIRGKGRGAQNFTVCSKFASFLYHLWIVYKIDILIKVRRVCPPWGAVSDALRRFTPAGPWRRWTPGPAVARGHWPKNQGARPRYAQHRRLPALCLHPCLPVCQGGAFGCGLGI